MTITIAIAIATAVINVTIAVAIPIIAPVVGPSPTTNRTPMCTTGECGKSVLFRSCW